MWSQIPEPLLLQIFMNLSIEDMSIISSVCHKWNRIAKDEFLWKMIFYKRFTNIDKSINRPKSSSGYREEAKRLINHTPMILSETLIDHNNQVLHVSFSHNGLMFSSCSRDGFVKVWSTQSIPTQVMYSCDMKYYSWNYTQYSQFNENDSLLLVSGVHFGAHTASGEIAVFNINDNFQLQCRVLNKPYDIFGTWYTNDYLISGRLHFLGHLVSCSALWLNKAWQEIESERKPIIKRMFKFYNKNASSIRTIMVANCLSDENEAHNRDDSNANNNHMNGSDHTNCDTYQRGNPVWSQFSDTNRRYKSLETPPNNSDQIDYYGAHSSEACTNESPIRYSAEYRCEQQSNRVTKYRNHKNRSNDTDSDNDFDDPPLPWNEEWLNLSDDESIDDVSKVNDSENAAIDQRLLGSRTSFSEEDSDSKSNRVLCNGDKLLVFTAGSLTYTPHQIGIKRIKPFEFEEFIKETASLAKRLEERKEEQERREGMAASPNWLDEKSVSHLFDGIDHIIDLKGHIIGMGLSPDHRYLYVNSRSWPENATIEHPLHPPPIAQQIDIHIIDLVTFKRVGNMLRSHKAYTPNDECFFIFLDVSEEFVASGAEDNQGYIWDRHYGNCLAKLPHNDIVNSVAFNPIDPEMLVTASDDFTLKIWRSKSKMNSL